MTPINNKELIHTLHQLGYQHQGLTIGYSQKSQIRWLSVLDMEGQKEEDVLKIRNIKPGVMFNMRLKWVLRQ